MSWLLVMAASADSWCARPLIAHEWGMTVLLPQGGRMSSPPIPPWIHRTAENGWPNEPVRTLPPDSGIRHLPVLSFFAVGSAPIPVGVEVGFHNGEASHWFPAVDQRTPGAEANTPEARQAHELLVRRRDGLDALASVDLGRDPSLQLHWDALTLTSKPASKPTLDATDWVVGSRAVEGALWINRARESDRFVFYEAATVERSALVVEAGGTAPNHFVLRNTSAFDVHDIAFMHDARVWTAPRIPAGKTAGFLLEEPLDSTALETWFTRRWATERAVLQPQADGVCVMGRHPAKPIEHADGHRLYPDEIAVLWSTWRRLLDDGGTRLLYREDPAAIDAQMPLAIYTDMFHDPSLFRLGIVSVENPPLP